MPIHLSLTFLWLCLSLMVIRPDWIFACVIMGYGMLIVVSGGLWDVTQNVSHDEANTPFDVSYVFPCSVDLD